MKDDQNFPNDDAFDFEPLPEGEAELSDLPPSRYADDEPLELPPVGGRRRRRQRKLIQLPTSHERVVIIEGMALRTTPTFDLFLFSALSGALIGAGYILDSNAILIMGILIAPLLRPLLGVIMGAATGEMRFFTQTLIGLLASFLFVFITGFLAGIAARIFLPLTFDQAFDHSSLWWPDLFLLATGAVLLTLSFIRSEEKPVLPGLMVVYELFLPISAAGFGLGNGVEGLFPNALWVFLVHFGIVVTLGMLIYFYMGFRPAFTNGKIFSGMILIGSLALAIGLSGIWTLIPSGMITPASSEQTTPTIPPAVATATITPIPSATRVPPTATSTATFTATIEPTPIYARVRSVGGGGIIRKSPNGDAITSVQNDYLVELVPDEIIIKDGTEWVHVLVRTSTGVIDGWVLQSLLITATPAPTSTATVALTPTP
jgi:hypothetical protein